MWNLQHRKVQKFLPKNIYKVSTGIQKTRLPNWISLYVLLDAGKDYEC
jgi:hypothetical protein